MDGEAEGSISRETWGEKVFTKTTERVRLGEDGVTEGEEGNGLKDGGEDGESWDVSKKRDLTEMGR